MDNYAERLEKAKSQLGRRGPELLEIVEWLVDPPSNHFIERTHELLMSITWNKGLSVADTDALYGMLKAQARMTGRIYGEIDHLSEVASDRS